MEATITIDEETIAEELRRDRDFIGSVAGEVVESSDLVSSLSDSTTLADNVASEMARNVDYSRLARAIDLGDLASDLAESHLSYQTVGRNINKGELAEAIMDDYGDDLAALVANHLPPTQTAGMNLLLERFAALESRVQAQAAVGITPGFTPIVVPEISDEVLRGMMTNLAEQLTNVKETIPTTNFRCEVEGVGFVFHRNADSGIWALCIRNSHAPRVSVQGVGGAVAMGQPDWLSTSLPRLVAVALAAAPYYFESVTRARQTADFLRQAWTAVTAIDGEGATLRR